ncbi:MAG: winged helix-turn-helix transcriptional regulator [Candidatus Doudnabacteria bacterium]|nr:winged helix-turn-helix transcriptional regulator [Candidatus Doudnabacteria bacterium]
MKELEKVFRALANRRRLSVVSYLKSNRRASVGEIAGAIKLSLKATSKHLRILNDAEIVEREQRGLTAYYFLGTDMPARTARIIHLL